MAKPKLTQEEANRLSIQLGYFYALHKFINERDVSLELGARLKVMLFEHIQARPAEARSSD
jgi:hypothetical protein